MSEVIIVMQAEVPPIIAKLAHYEMSKHKCVNQVLFARKAQDLNGHMAVLVPDTGSVIIDLDACIKDMRWMAKGATFIANAWFNILYCIFHEGRHAEQIDDAAEDGFVVDDSELHEMDTDADEYALEAMIDWCQANPLPTLEGWIGERIKTTFNAMYANYTQLVERELEVCGKAAANAKLAAIHNNRKPEPATKEIPGAVDELASLLTAIEGGWVDVVRLAGEPYLSAGDFLEMSKL